jgi:hypothetical protein
MAHQPESNTGSRVRLREHLNKQLTMEVVVEIKQIQLLGSKLVAKDHQENSAINTLLRVVKH